MFLSREIDIKLCQIHTKIHKYGISYNKCCSIKQIIFNKYATNLKTTISHSNLRISGFLFLILIDIIYNIITNSPYSPYYVTRTSANGSLVSCSRDTYGNHVTPFHFFHYSPFKLFKKEILYFSKL